MKKIFSSPLALPIYGFAGAVLAGGILLSRGFCATGEAVPFLDALFMSTSAVCITGLTVLDIGTIFSTAGQTILLILVQLGGLGIITYSSLIMILWRKKVSLRDHLAVGKVLLHDPSFDLRLFILHVAAYTFFIELIGALILYCTQSGLSLFHAVFLAVCGFCNAGFTLFSNNLTAYADNLVVLLTMSGLIILGGISFAVMEDVFYTVTGRWRGLHRKLSLTSKIVLYTSAFLIIGGAVAFFLCEAASGEQMDGQLLLTSFFQSVSARSAGFNTTDTAAISNASIFLFIVLMVIGGSPGSCAGGIKTTTFVVLLAFVRSTLTARPQVEIGSVAVDRQTVNKAVTLLILAVLVIGLTVFVLSLSESANVADEQHRMLPLYFFEAASAFGTVGISMGLTPHLSLLGKILIMLVIFVGRIGPLWVLSFIREIKRNQRYRLAETDLPIG